LNFDVAFKDGTGVVAWVERNWEGRVLDAGAGGRRIEAHTAVVAQAGL